jgi:hypothetical protein
MIPMKFDLVHIFLTYVITVRFYTTLTHTGFRHLSSRKVEALATDTSSRVTWNRQDGAVAML